MMKKQFQPNWADLGAKMKWMAGVTLGASCFLGACATSAIGEESADREFNEVEVRREVIVTNSSSGDGEHTVRMVIEGDGDEERSFLCVWVPAGGESAGAISCPGRDVRVFEFGGPHGRQIVIGDEVVDEEEIRRLVEIRLAEVNEQLANMDAWDIQVHEAFDNEEFQREMAVLEREMEQLHHELRFAPRDGEDMTPEERAEFEAEMAEFQAEMAEFQAEMHSLQAEVMAEVAAEMAALQAEGVYVRSAPHAPDAPHAMRWVTDGGHMSRNVIRVNRDGREQVTIIENIEDEDGNPKLVIRTTDPSSVEVIQLDPDDLDDDLHFEVE